MIKKLDHASVPSDKVNDLKSLIPTNYVEYIVVGNNYYELYPTQSLKLLEVVSKVIEMIEVTKRVKMERYSMNDDDKLKEIANEKVTIQDVLSIESNQVSIREVLEAILVGVDVDDFKNMTLSQTIDILTKLVKVNMDSFPESFKKDFFNMNKVISDMSTKTTEDVLNEREGKN